MNSLVIYAISRCVPSSSSQSRVKKTQRENILREDKKRVYSFILSKQRERRIIKSGKRNKPTTFCVLLLFPFRLFFLFLLLPSHNIQGKPTLINGVQQESLFSTVIFIACFSAIYTHTARDRLS